MASHNGFAFRSKLDVQKKYLIVFIIGFIFILNYPKLHLYFLSDDFWFIYRYRYLKDVLEASAPYHVNPVPQFFIFYLGNLLAGFNPLYYHVITLLFHTFNVLLVFKLAEILFRNKWISTVSSLLFTTYFMNYEVVYWITGIFYILLTTFYISALLFFIQYLNEKKKIYYALFVITFSLAVLTMEQGVTLLGACILCEIFVSDFLRRLKSSPHWKQKGLFFVKNFTKKYTLPVIIIMLFLIFKKWINQGFVVNIHTFPSFIKTIFGMIWHLLIPYPYGIGTSQWNHRIYLTLFLFGTLSYLFLRKYTQRDKLKSKSEPILNSDMALYLFLFGCILNYVIPQSIATILQPRYFYLPSVFSVILLGNLLIKSISIAAKSQNNIRMILHSVVAIFITVSIPVNIGFLVTQYHHWQTASIITKNILNDTGLFLSEDMNGQNLYYVNLPDGVYKRSHPGWPDAYIFRNAIDMAVRLTYPAKKIGKIMACRTKNPKGVITFPEHELITEEQLHRLSANENNLVLMYDAQLQTIKKLGNRMTAYDTSKNSEIISGFEFRDRMNKRKVERQIKEMYTDLINARARAIDRNRMHFDVGSSISYTIYEDTNPVPDGDGQFQASLDTPLPNYPKTVEYLINWTGAGNRLNFDKRGVISPLGSIYLTPYVDADYDCISVTSMRMNLGKWNASTSTCIEK